MNITCVALKTMGRKRYMSLPIYHPISTLTLTLPGCCDGAAAGVNVPGETENDGRHAGRAGPGAAGHLRTHRAPLRGEDWGTGNLP